jgi:site-specific recombinase XerD
LRALLASTATVNEILDSFLKGAVCGKWANTARNYRDAFRCVREQLSTRKAQTISKDDVEDLVDYMLTRGRKRGGSREPGCRGGR